MSASNPKLIAIVVGVVILLTLIFQNTQVVTLHFLFWEKQLSIALFCPIVFILGAVFGWLGYHLYSKKKARMAGL